MKKLKPIPESFKNLIARAHGFKRYTDIMSISQLLLINEDINAQWVNIGPKLYLWSYTANFERLPEASPPDFIPGNGFGDYFADVFRPVGNYEKVIKQLNAIETEFYKRTKSALLVTWFLKQGTPRHLQIARRLHEIGNN